jgi:hypothetical protein
MRKKIYILLVLTLCFVVAYIDFSRPEFDSEKWKNSDCDSPNLSVRRDMVDALTASSILKNKTKHQVIDILGEPDNPEGYFKEYNLVYCIGPERGFGVDYEWLAIKLSSDDTVSEYRLVRD